MKTLGWVAGSGISSIFLAFWFHLEGKRENEEGGAGEGGGRKAVARWRYVRMQDGWSDSKE